MSNRPSWIGSLEAKKQYLEEWLRRRRLTDEVAAEVQKNLALTDWQLKTVESRPPEADEIPLPDVGDTFDSDDASWRAALPLMPEYNKHMIVAASPFSTGGTVSLLEFAGRVGDLGTPTAINYAAEARRSLESLYEQYDRPNEVRKAIEALAASSLQRRFEHAQDEYHRYTRGEATRASVGNLLRNLVYGVRGELWERARTRPHENMNWQTMAERLAIAGPGSPQFHELMRQGTRAQSFIARLSDVAKDREAGSATNVALLWTEISDWILTVLRLIRGDRTQPENPASA